MEATAQPPGFPLGCQWKVRIPGHPRGFVPACVYPGSKRPSAKDFVAFIDFLMRILACDVFQVVPVPSSLSRTNQLPHHMTSLHSMHVRCRLVWMALANWAAPNGLTRTFNRHSFTPAQHGTSST